MKRCFLKSLLITIFALCCLPGKASAADPKITFTNYFDSAPAGDLNIKISNLQDSNPGSCSDLESAPVKLVMTVQANGRTYKSDPVLINDIKNLGEVSDYSAPFHFPKLPTDRTTGVVKYSLSISPTNFERKQDASGNDQKPYGVSSIYDTVDSSGTVKLFLNWKEGAGGSKERKRTYTYHARLSEDYIGSYYLKGGTEKEYLMFHTYDDCVKFLGDPALCEGSERCYHKDKACPYWDPNCGHQVKNPDKE